MVRILVYLIIFIQSSFSLVMDSREGDSLALADLHSYLNGASWMGSSNWDDGIPIDQWYGVVLSGNRVDSIKISEQFIEGDVPSSIENLSQLTSLSITVSISDSFGIQSLPKELGSLSNLKNLRIVTSKLKTIPYEIHNLTNLEHLQILLYDQYGLGVDYSKFVSLKSLSTSDTLITTYNVLNDLVNLEWVYLEYSMMKGLPSRIGEWSNLYEIWLHYNSLSMEDYEYLKTIGVSTIKFGTQINRGDTANVSYSEGMRIGVPVEGSENHYRWYKDGVDIDSLFDSDSLPVFEPGKYHVEVTSDLAEDMQDYFPPKVIYSPIIVDMTVNLADFKNSTQNKKSTLRKGKVDVYGLDGKFVRQVDLVVGENLRLPENKVFILKQPGNTVVFNSE